MGYCTPVSLPLRKTSSVGTESLSVPSDGKRMLWPLGASGERGCQEGFSEPLAHCVGHLSDSRPWARARARTGLSHSEPEGEESEIVEKGGANLAKRAEILGPEGTEFRFSLFFFFPV